MSANVSWNFRLSIREGQFDNFNTLMTEMVESTQAESGTLVYEWFLSEDKTTCHIYERYAESDSVMVHLGNFGSKFAARFLEYLEPTSLTVYGDPTDQVRGALEGLGPVYLGLVGGFTR